MFCCNDKFNYYFSPFLACLKGNIPNPTISGLDFFKVRVASDPTINSSDSVVLVSSLKGISFDLMSPYE